VAKRAKKDSSAVAWAVGLSTLVVAGVVIVLYEQSQATPAGSVTIPNPINGTATTLTPAQAASLFASVNSTTVAALQSGGIPQALWVQASPGIQQALIAYGLHANAT
jgi:hypothetical protein